MYTTGKKDKETYDEQRIRILRSLKGTSIHKEEPDEYTFSTEGMGHYILGQQDSSESDQWYLEDESFPSYGLKGQSTKADEERWLDKIEMDTPF